ncbi:hypothetical protein, partial [Agathobaculum sp.]|uniref:hypothetical protein n=1 Tax=Agathobaculum sp. TaxID=2048138 RepID=UPI003A92CDB5
MYPYLQKQQKHRTFNHSVRKGPTAILGNFFGSVRNLLENSHSPQRLFQLEFLRRSPAADYNQSIFTH